MTLYADTVTDSMERAIGETRRRRDIQIAYNTKHGITPTTIKKKIKDITEAMRTEHTKTVDELLRIDQLAYEKDPRELIRDKEKQMGEAVKELDFETAAILRDEIRALEERLGVSVRRAKRAEKAAKKERPNFF